MLLNKYEKFSILKYDSFIEELLFKYEKNINNFQTFEKKGRSLLQTILQIVNESSIKDNIQQINQCYEELMKIAEKFQTLSKNQQFVYQTLIDKLKSKPNDSLIVLKEVYIIQKFLDSMQQEFSKDCQNKYELISKRLPIYIFESFDSTIVENLLFLLDLWSFSYIVNIQQQ